MWRCGYVPVAGELQFGDKKSTGDLPAVRKIPKIMTVVFFRDTIIPVPFMFSIPKLLGNENLFFGLLEASALETHNSVPSLIKLSQSLHQSVELETFALARRRNKEITRQIHNVGYDTLGITTSIQAVGAGGINGLEK